MNRSEVIAVLRAVIEARTTAIPRIVGSAALVIHGIQDECNDLNLYLSPREWGILTAHETTVQNAHHPSGSVVRTVLGHQVTFACVQDYVQMWTTQLATDTEGETPVGITACVPELGYLLGVYELQHSLNPRDDFAAVIEKIKAKLAA